MAGSGRVKFVKCERKDLFQRENHLNTVQVALNVSYGRSVRLEGSLRGRDFSAVKKGIYYCSGLAEKRLHI